MNLFMLLELLKSFQVFFAVVTIKLFLLSVNFGMLVQRPLVLESFLTNGTTEGFRAMSFFVMFA